MGALHGVDGHFDLLPPPAPIGSGRVSLCRGQVRLGRHRPPLDAERHCRPAYAAINAWIKLQKEPDLSRPEAIRRLVELGLKAKGK